MDGVGWVGGEGVSGRREGGGSDGRMWCTYVYVEAV